MPTLKIEKCNERGDVCLFKCLFKALRYKISEKTALYGNMRMQLIFKAIERF